VRNGFFIPYRPVLEGEKHLHLLQILHDGKDIEDCEIYNYVMQQGYEYLAGNMTEEELRSRIGSLWCEHSCITSTVFKENQQSFIGYLVVLARLQLYKVFLF
jgi:hypothetical protein